MDVEGAMPGLFYVGVDGALLAESSFARGMSAAVAGVALRRGGNAAAGLDDAVFPVNSPHTYRHTFNLFELN
jgi:hypothetical protein